MRKFIFIAAALAAAGCQKSSTGSANEHNSGASNNDVGASETADRTQRNPSATPTQTTTTAPAGDMQGAGVSGAQTGSTNDMTAQTAQGQMPSEMFSNDMVINRLHAINHEEIEAGKMAQKNGSKQVQSFGKTLVTDHQAMDKQGDATAKELKVQVKDPMKMNWPEPVKQDMQSDMAMMDKLKDMKGNQFDQQFLTMMVQGHTKALDYLKQVESSAQDDKVKQLATAAAPKVQKHLTTAQQLLDTTGAKVQGRR